jgi:hypothetical protein
LGGSRLGWQLCTAGVGLVDGDGAQQRRLEVGTATVSELDPRGWACVWLLLRPGGCEWIKAWRSGLR